MKFEFRIPKVRVIITITLFLLWLSTIAVFIGLILSETSDYVVRNNLGVIVQDSIGITILVGVISFALFLIFFVLFFIKDKGLRVSCIGLIMLSVIALTVVLSGPSTAVVTNNTDTSIQPFQPKDLLTEVSIENAINDYRIQNGKNRLDKHDPLCDLAKIRVYEIKSDWSHQGFESRKDGDLFARFCNTEKLDCLGIGENLAMNFNTVSDVMNGWINSEGHRENMLGDYNVQCVAVDNGYITSMFAKVEDIKKSQAIYKQADNNNSKVTYNYEMVKEWEGILKNDENAKDNWEGGLDSENYESKSVASIVQDLNEKVQIARKVIDGVTNSNITNKELDDLISRHNKLFNDIESKAKKANAEAYENCKESWEELEEDYGQDYSEQKSTCKDYID